MRIAVFLGFLGAFWLGGLKGIEGKPVALQDSYRFYGSDSSFFSKRTQDVIEGKRPLNVQFSSDGVQVSAGPSTEEIAAYIAFASGILIVAICCFCCCKHCCCEPKPQPTTIIYQQMTQPRTNGLINPANSRFGGAVGALNVNFDPMPSVAQISNRQPPAYSTTNTTTNIPL